MEILALYSLMLKILRESRFIIIKFLLMDNYCEFYLFIINFIRENPIFNYNDHFYCKNDNEVIKISYSANFDNP